MNYVPGVGNPSARLMVCAEAPGEEEVEKQEPLVGPTGRLTREICESVGVEWESTYRTNVIKVRPPNNDLKKLEVEIESFYPQLFHEIEAIRPNCILALGGVALRALTGKTGIRTWRGSILGTVGTILPKVVATYHPSNFLGHRQNTKTEHEGVDYSALAYVKLDFERAARESQFKEFRLPQRILEVARNSSDVWRFLNQYRKEKIAAIDIEVSKSIPVCIAISFRANHAMSIPLLNIGRGYKVPPTELAMMWRLVAEFLANPNIKKVGQNGKFDVRQIQVICGMPVVNYWADTMLIAHTLYAELPQSLQFLTSVHTDEPYYKDELKDYAEKHGSFDDLCMYNAKDACVTREILDIQLAELEESGLTSYYFDYKHKLHDLYMAIEREGFNRDPERYRKTYIKYTGMMADALIEINQILQPYYPQGVTLRNIRYFGWVRDCLFNKLRLPVRATTGEDDLVALQANHGTSETKYRIIDLILEIRRIGKTIGTYLEADADFDGKIRTNYRITGTTTGRSSTAVLKPPNRPFQMGLAFQTITKHGEIGADLGYIYVPDSGYIFMNVDEKQAEARVVAKLANDDDLLSKFDTIDVHKWTANFCLGIDIDKLTEGERYVGKTVRHMGNLGAGKRRFMIELNNGAKKFRIQIPNISEWKAGQLLATFHKNSPNIRGVFHQEIEEALARDNQILRSPTGWRRQFFERSGSHELFSEAYPYIPQDTVQFINKRAMLMVKEKRPDVRILLEGHDGSLYMIPEKDQDEMREMVTEFMQLPVDFSRCSLPRESLSIPCEVSFGYNYKELKKWTG